MKVGIVGTGFVGATAAYAMVMRGICRELVLIDLNQDRARAEADDILHAVPFAQPVQVHAGGYEDLKDSKVVIITAGVSQKPGESRLQLLERNAAVFHNVIPAILDQTPEAILLVATNPVDIMTHLAARFASDYGVPSSRVIGSGTTLDTARFRALLSRQLGVDAQHVHAYVLGEHGDSEVLTWSLVTVGGIPLNEFCEIRRLSVCEEDQHAIDDNVRKAAYQIIDGKGATYYGVGAALSRIVEVILRDQRSILTICTPVGSIFGVEDVTIALPNLLGGGGVIDTLTPQLNQEEEHALHASAVIIKKAIDSIHI
jgi:L-lactate dehydrogenase